jgi:hypothetical protein
VFRSFKMKQAPLSSTVHGAAGSGERSCVGVNRPRDDAIIVAAGFQFSERSSDKFKRVANRVIDRRRDRLSAEVVAALLDEQPEECGGSLDRRRQLLLSLSLAVGSTNDLVEQPFALALGFLLADFPSCLATDADPAPAASPLACDPLAQHDWLMVGRRSGEVTLPVGFFTDRQLCTGMRW